MSGAFEFGGKPDREHRNLSTVIALLMRDQGLESFTISDRELTTNNDTLIYSRDFYRAAYIITLKEGT